jgi:hypothetical protein
MSSPRGNLAEIQAQGDEELLSQEKFSLKKNSITGAAAKDYKKPTAFVNETDHKMKQCCADFNSLDEMGRELSIIKHKIKQCCADFNALDEMGRELSIIRHKISVEAIQNVP